MLGGQCAEDFQGQENELQAQLSSICTRKGGFRYIPLKACSSKRENTSWGDKDAMNELTGRPTCDWQGGERQGGSGPLAGTGGCNGLMVILNIISSKPISGSQIQQQHLVIFVHRATHVLASSVHTLIVKKKHWLVSFRIAAVQSH